MQQKKKFNKTYKLGKDISKLNLSWVKFYIPEINKLKIKNKIGSLIINLDGKLNENT